ncbi:putative mannitol dehydrogenase [Apostasia shenzhenica]|uniref:Putative mannitol dehydrogenase n=1 Tax=Apostasia shenzhenica TaxID=1088818 RepID=A0A2H9ZZY0_9ASPA|nr:putative mannitol dehydrogenase [Apostasia shenzhenica]
MAAKENGKKVSPEEEHPRKAFGLAAKDSSGALSPFTFSRRNNGDDDVTIKILYCGICHTDLHSVKNEWKNTIYPIVPGYVLIFPRKYTLNREIYSIFMILYYVI